MEYEDSFLANIQAMGQLGYSVDKMINILDVENQDGFKSDFNNKTSPLFKAYQKGVDKSDFIIDQKLYSLAKEGDLKAIEMYDKMKRNRKMNR